MRRYGTPDFMAPEQIVGDWAADHRSDIYALGLVAFNALAGRLPGTRGLLDAPPLRQVAPHVPAALARVVDRCLARDPQRRWPNAEALRAALARATRAGASRTALAQSLRARSASYLWEFEETVSRLIARLRGLQGTW